MKIEINIHIHQPSNAGAFEKGLDEIKRLIINQSKFMGKELDDLTTQVAKNTSVEQSAVELLTGLKSKLDAALNDPAALKALSDSLGTSAEGLAAAIVANTPAAPVE